MLVTTDRGRGQDNAFYIDLVDLAGAPIKRPLANQPPGSPIDPEAMNIDDPITFDIKDGLLGIHTHAEWKGRKIRQRADSFDWLDPLHQGTG